MIKHKEHTVTCECGATFTALGNRTTYCPECARKRAAAQRARYNAKRREERAAEEDDLHFCDNPEQIRACLNCKEKFCLGDGCQTNRSLRKRHAGRHPLESGTREKVVSLRANGLSQREIAQMLGISQSTVGRFLKQSGGN